ncbi:MAG TPA: hypothetical protein GX708_15495 [Gallicola sp.]|nr:hypothetical protein [Gallicola sp.]
MSNLVYKKELKSILTLFKNKDELEDQKILKLVLFIQNNILKENIAIYQSVSTSSNAPSSNIGVYEIINKSFSIIYEFINDDYMFSNTLSDVEMFNLFSAIISNTFSLIYFTNLKKVLVVKYIKCLVNLKRYYF